VRNELLHGFYLDDLFVEPLSGTVTGPNHSEHLPPNASELLLCLASDPDSLISRDDLLLEELNMTLDELTSLDREFGDEQPHFSGVSQHSAPNRQIFG
jgi:DNA-binding response OmpR family regulator